MTPDKTWVDDPKLLDQLSKETESEHAPRQSENRGFLRRYWDRTVMPEGFRYSTRAAALEVYNNLAEELGDNLTAEIVDLAQSVICRDMASEVLPLGADYELEQGCKEASRLIEGVFENSNFGDIQSECARDGMTADCGPSKGFIEDGEIKFERINPLELFWVDDETPNPRTIMTISPVSRDALAAQFPAKKSEIYDLPSWRPPTVVGVDLRSPGSRLRNTVRVVEAWCRALGTKGEPGYSKGRHTICSGSLILLDEEWEHNITPVVRFVWSPQFTGYGGKSIARIVKKHHNAHKKLMRQMYEGLAGSVPWLLTHEDSEIEAVGDMPYQQVKWSGLVPPSVTVPAAVSPQVIAEIKENRSRAYAAAGQNENMAAGQLGKQYNSAVAQEKAVDVVNTRLLQAQNMWQRVWTDASRVVVMLANQAKKTHVYLKGENRYVQVKWPNLKTDQYRIRFGLSSGLSLTPSGRLADLERLRDAGAIDMPAFLRNLDLPDTRSEADRANAPMDLVMQQIDAAISHGEFRMPSKIQGADMLQEIVKTGGQVYQQSVLRGNVPLKNMEALRKLIKAAEARLPQPAPAGVPAAVPVAAPVPAPATSPVPGAPPVAAAA